MLISLQEAAGFVATYSMVFDELWRRRDDPLTEAEILGIISATLCPATPAYLLGQLRRMRFIIETDDQTAVWELAPPFQRWVEHLQQISRPVSSARVRGQLAELEQKLNAFRVAEGRADLATARELLRETRAGFQLLAEDLGQTRSAIALAVNEAKSEHRKQSAVERFRRINRFWTEYLVPMLDLLDPTGPLEAICVGWETQLLGSFENKFLPDRTLGERIETEMRILRVAVRRSFRECRNELEPLHARLRRDSMWAEGAARILREIETNGAAGSALAETMPLSTFRFAGQIPTAALVASAARWRDLSESPPAIDFAGTAGDRDVEGVEEILAAIEARHTDFPVADLLMWLGTTQPSRRFNTVLQAFSLIVTDSRYQASFRFPVREYELAGGIVRCGCVRLALRPNS